MTGESSEQARAGSLTSGAPTVTLFGKYVAAWFFGMSVNLSSSYRKSSLTSLQGQWEGPPFETPPPTSFFSEILYPEPDSARSRPSRASCLYNLRKRLQNYKYKATRVGGFRRSLCQGGFPGEASLTSSKYTPGARLYSKGNWIFAWWW